MRRMRHHRRRKLRFRLYQRWQPATPAVLSSGRNNSSASREALARSNHSHQREQQHLMFTDQRQERSHGDTSTSSINVSGISYSSASSRVRSCATSRSISSSRREPPSQPHKQKQHSVAYKERNQSLSFLRKWTLAAGVISPYLLSLSGVLMAYYIQLNGGNTSSADMF